MQVYQSFFSSLHKTTKKESCLILVLGCVRKISVKASRGSIDKFLSEERGF